MLMGFVYDGELLSWEEEKEEVSVCDVEVFWDLSWWCFTVAVEYI